MSDKLESGQTVTLKTIADELGVSITTVARSLKGGHKISPKTIEKVRVTAERLGYVRNLDGMRLSTGRTMIIITLLGFTKEEEVGDSGSVGLLNGLHTRFSDTEYAVRTIPVTIGDSGLEHVRDLVRGRNADGLVLDHTEPNDPRVQYLLDNDVPFISFGRTEQSSRHAFLDIDNEYAAWQGTNALIEAGFKKIALMDADPRFAFVQQRVAGYQRALKEHGQRHDPSLISHISPQADVARAKAIEQAQNGVDAFVCVNELVFLGVRAGARRVLGGAAEDLGYSVRTGTNIGEYIGTPLYSSFYSRVEAGWALADLLLRRIEGRPIEDCQKLVRTQLRSPKGIPN